MNQVRSNYNPLQTRPGRQEGNIGAGIRIELMTSHNELVSVHVAEYSVLIHLIITVCVISMNVVGPVLVYKKVASKTPLLSKVFGISFGIFMSY